MHDTNDLIKVIAFYLPQFHPVAENDEWWGKGFTEWTNVAKTKPSFEGHYQPHLPSDFGYYDLRVKETRLEQIDLAKEYGINGFCYHYYWFSGKKILNRPLDEMLADPALDMPFCLCWANENWTRRWDAAEHEILIEQKYLPDDDLNFIKSLAPFLKDPRYIKVDGKSLLVVYRPQHLPDPKKSASIWREYCLDNGIGELHICSALTHGNFNYTQFGFDSGVEFPPHNLKVRNINKLIKFSSSFSGNVIDFAAVAKSYLDREYRDPSVYKCVFPSWDNTARTGERAMIIVNESPDNYQWWLSKTIESNTSKSAPVFINAWNEWAEGCHLEPDHRHKHAYLKATLNAINGNDGSVEPTPYAPTTAFPAQTRKLLPDIAEVLCFHIKNFRNKLISYLILFINKYPWLKDILKAIFSRLRGFLNR